MSQDPFTGRLGDNRRTPWPCRFIYGIFVAVLFYTLYVGVTRP